MRVHLGKERSWQDEQVERRPGGGTCLVHRRASEGTNVAGAEAGGLEKRPDR